jgi:hypothetical protein
MDFLQKYLCGVFEPPTKNQENQVGRAWDLANDFCFGRPLVACGLALLLVASSY